MLFVMLGLYAIFFSPLFASMISSLIIPHVPHWLRKELANNLLRDADSKGGNRVYLDRTAELEQAGRMDPGNPGVWWRLCEGYSAAKDWGSAQRACLQQVNLKMDDDSLDDLSGVYMHMHEYSRAAQVLERGSGPRGGSILYLDALLASGQYQKAITAAQKLVDLGENGGRNAGTEILPEALRGLAFAYQQLGEGGNAKQAFERLQTLNPTFHYQSCIMRPNLQISDIPIIQCF
jgi:tetratricopeptide (TPR) repeat protein